MEKLFKELGWVINSMELLPFRKALMPIKNQSYSKMEWELTSTKISAGALIDM
jgi:hypothetical protein